ncbi:MAG: hypothetical protein NZ526_05795 [Aquificaceae bacterium]|nr:hypothetical protein [Aquificaceae bacterium]
MPFARRFLPAFLSGELSPSTSLMNLISASSFSFCFSFSVASSLSRNASASYINSSFVSALSSTFSMLTPPTFKWFIFFSMNLTEVITIISALTVVIGIAVSLLNKRIEDTNRRIDDTNRKIDELRQELKELRQEFKEELREIRQLLYKVLEIPQKEDK